MISQHVYRNTLWINQLHVSTTVNHFYEKLFRLRDLMNTDTAKKIAEQREDYMKSYISEFLDEWDGVR